MNSTDIILIGVIVMLISLAWSVRKMSTTVENTTTALNEIKAALDAEIAANTKFRADVTAALAALSGTNLTAEQQAIVDSIKAEAAQDTAATTAADEVLNPPAAPAA